MNPPLPALDAPPPASLVFVTDQPQASALFLLHRALAAHLARPHAGPTILVALTDTLPHWRAIAFKSHIRLDAHLAAGRLHFVDALSPSLASPTPGVVLCPPLFPEDSAPSLAPLYQMLANMLSPADPTRANPLIIIDDLSALEWMAMPVLEINRFIRALRALIRKTSASAVVRYRHLPAEELSDLEQRLIRQCQIHVEVMELSSGRSGAVSGEIAIHPGHGQLGPIPGLRAREQALQYRLTDAGAVYFERGTSQMVL